MQGHDIIVIGASAGGVESVSSLLKALPPDLPAALFVVIHTAAARPSLLAEVLARSTPLSVAAAIDGEPVEMGHVSVAPPDNHLLLASGFVRVVRGAKENGHRPAVDPLFRTAARAYGSRVVGVVLSGTRDCGTEGLQEVKHHGGIAVVQDPADALFPGMPQSAVDNVEVDHCIPLKEIPALISRLVHEPAKVPDAEAVTPESEMAEVEFTCPGCGGHLMRRESGAVVHFGCKVGHRFSPESLQAEQAGALEVALWIALRAIEDSTALSRRLAARAAAQHHAHAAAHYMEQVRHGEVQAGLVRQALTGSPAESSERSSEPAPPLGRTRRLGR